MELIIRVFTDSLLDVLRMLPFMFITLFLADLLIIRIRAVKAIDSVPGVLAGAFAGLIPECGVSAGFAKLYAGGSIGLGVLIAALLSCSDEALIVAAGNADLGLIISMLAAKVVISAFFGLAIYFFMRAGGRKKAEQVNLSDDDRKKTISSIIIKNIKNTTVTALYIFAAVLVLNLIIAYLGNNIIEGFFSESRFLQPVAAAILGLIPSCVPSVVLTEAHLKGLIGFGALISGLCANSGYGIIVLFKNLPLKKSLAIAGLILAISILSGEILTIFTS